jgi:hypothetical protein
MTVSNTVRTATINGDGTTGPFQFVIYFLANSDIAVTKTSVAGINSQLAEVRDYTLTGAGSPMGGVITPVVALQTGETLTIARVLPLLQCVDLSNQGAVFPETLETALDRLTMIAQQQQTQINNNAGPQGPQGVVGAQGPQGSTYGVQGPQGSAGSQGPQGSTGAQGPSGPGGNQGSQGLTGSQGYQGNAGPQGPQGVQGFQGYQGAQGISGTQGGTGVQGPQGAQGYQGPQGVTGLSGYQGPQGTQGTPGLGLTAIGTPWTSGQNWVVSNAPSYNGNMYVCIENITGSTTPPSSDTTHFVLLAAQGAQGTTGATGSQGPQGYMGYQGYSGPQGNQGNQGSQGPQGVQGNVGSQGAAGSQGVQGAAGPQGVIGPQGLSGSQGPMGSQGYAGSQGAPGSQGAAGAQGAQGTIGPEFTTEQYALTTTPGSWASINVGNVTAGDRILVTGMFSISGGSSSTVAGSIWTSGTATVSFCGPSGSLPAITTPQVPAATGLIDCGLSGVVCVNASGTLTLSGELSYGGTPSSYAIYIYSVFYRKQ